MFTAYPEQEIVIPKKEGESGAKWQLRFWPLNRGMFLAQSIHWQSWGEVKVIQWQLT